MDGVELVAVFGDVGEGVCLVEFVGVVLLEGDVYADDVEACTVVADCGTSGTAVEVEQAGAGAVHGGSLLGCCAPFWGGFVALVAVRGLGGVCVR